MTSSAPDFASIVERLIETAEWLQFPSTCLTRAPHNKELTCDLRIDPTPAHNDFRANMRTTAFDLWSRVIGCLPPVAGARMPVDGELVGLPAAHACFLGVNRPFGDDDLGSNVLAYVTKPQWLYVYEPSMTSVAKLRKVPLDVVFVIYVKLDKEYSTTGGNAGVVTHWSTVESDRENPYLPRDHGKRFSHRLW